MVGNNGTTPSTVAPIVANSYTGGTTVNAGTLSLNFNNASVLTNILYNTFSATTIGTGQSLTLGGTPIQNFIAVLNPNNVNAISYGALSVTASTTAASTSTQSFGQLILNSNVYGTITLTNPTATIGLNVNLGAITRNPGSLLAITLPAANISGDGLFTTTPNINSNGILGGWAVVGGASWAVSAGSSGSPGLITSLATGSYVAPNVATATSNVDFTTTATGTLASSTINSLRLSATTANQTLTLASGSNVITTGGILMQSGATQSPTISGGTGLTSGTSELMVTAISSTIETIIATPITDNGLTHVGLTYVGATAGINASIGLSLYAANTFSGPITILSGLLRINPQGTYYALGSGGTYAGNIVDNGQINFNLVLASADNTQNSVLASSADPEHWESIIRALEAAMSFSAERTRIPA